VVDFDAGTVTVIDTATRQVVKIVPVGGKPQSVVFAPDGRRSYVIDNKSNLLHTIDADTNTVTGSVQVDPGASMVALSPNKGTFAYVSSRDSSLITTFRTAA
jgi:YVTN family beta-propeller protein